MRNKITCNNLNYSLESHHSFSLKKYFQDNSIKRKGRNANIINNNTNNNNNDNISGNSCAAQPYGYDYDISDEVCVFIVHGNNGGKWHDLSCDSRKCTGVCDGPYYNGVEFFEDSLSYVQIGIIFHFYN